MPWWGWLLSVLAVLAGAGLLASWTLRRSARGRAFLALSTKQKLRFGKALLKDSSVPWPARLALILLVAYLALPFDIVPDFIPVVGQADDVAVVLVVVCVLVLSIPRERFEAALRSATGGDDDSVSGE
jgi:uncharacterized membrane protein YkvA (DUF1232 family)